MSSNAQTMSKCLYLAEKPQWRHRAQSGSEWGPSNPVLSYLTIERIPVSTRTQQISKRSIGPKRDNNFTCKHLEHTRGLIFLRVPWCTFFLEKIFPYWWKYSLAGTLCICSQRQKKKKNYEDTTTYLQSRWRRCVQTEIHWTNYLQILSLLRAFLVGTIFVGDNSKYWCKKNFFP
jgi:hypothetical protein